MSFLKTLFKGLRFGLILQLAVGPVCLMVFNAAAAEGLLSGLTLMLAAAFVDAVYITLSALGAAALLSKPRLKRIIRYVGCAVLLLFGADMLLSALGFGLLPSIKLFDGAGAGSAFLRGILVTASNPLTIVFWGGVFTAQADEIGKCGLFPFGAGCVCATVLFLSLTAAIGTAAGEFLPDIVITVLNAAAGAAVMLFGVRMALKKEKAPVNSDNHGNQGNHDNGSDKA